MKAFLFPQVGKLVLHQAGGDATETREGALEVTAEPSVRKVCALGWSRPATLQGTGHTALVRAVEAVGFNGRGWCARPRGTHILVETTKGCRPSGDALLLGGGGKDWLVPCCGVAWQSLPCVGHRGDGSGMGPSTAPSLEMHAHLLSVTARAHLLVAMPKPKPTWGRSSHEPQNICLS